MAKPLRTSMKLWHGLVACGAIVGTGACLGQVYRAQQAELESIRGKLGTLSQAVDQAQRAGEERTRVRAAREVDMAVAAAPSMEPKPRSSDEVAHATPAASPTHEERRAEYASTFATEPIDGKWAPMSRALVTKKLTAALQGTSEIRSVECRASMCKIESTHQNLAEYHAFVNSAFMDPRTMPWNSGIDVSGKQDPQTGRFVAVAYLAREGEELPE